MTEIVWRSGDDPVDEAEIERVQAYFRQRFPEDFIEVVRRCNGGAPDLDYVVRDDGVCETLDHLLSFTPASRDHIVRVAAGYFEYLPAGVLPFAEDGAGNPWVFDFRSNPEAPTVCFVFHENFRTDDRESALRPFAASFTEMLSMLQADNPELDGLDDT